jgi:hypothetical protein
MKRMQRWLIVVLVALAMACAGAKAAGAHEDDGYDWIYGVCSSYNQGETHYASDGGWLDHDAVCVRDWNTWGPYEWCEWSGGEIPHYYVDEYCFTPRYYWFE